MDEREWARRQQEIMPRVQVGTRDYEHLYQRYVQQAHLGGDFPFLRHASLRDGE